MQILPKAVATLRDGSLSEHLEAVQARIRVAPADADLRAQLFQLAAVQGDWPRAAEQLTLCAQFNPQAGPMATLYAQAIAGERQRETVLAGDDEPAFFAGRSAWCEALLQALRLQAAQPSQAADLRAQALQEAGTRAGILAGEAAGLPARYGWIADGDSRLGPVCEWIAGGRYGWLPFEDILRISLLAPDGLCDVLWARAEVMLADGRVLHGLVPARYPAPLGETLAGQGEALRLGRETRWRPLGDDAYAGAGQKMWITDAGEYALLDVRGLDQEAG